ncbi:MAG: hypothetical protein RI894_195, partial [Bacteroidota bacterium]
MANSYMKLSFFIALFLASLLCEGTREIAVGSVAAGSMAVGVVSQAGDFPETKTMLTAREIT